MPAPLRATLLGATVLTALPLVGCGGGAACAPVEGTVAARPGERARAADARVTPRQARTAALLAVPGAQVVDVELEAENGWLVYEVELHRDPADYDVLVDAGTGRVLCTERD
jgi:uncharacterized membrane protein YkoI